MNPHILTYEVMDITKSMGKTVFTSESFDEASKEFYSFLDKTRRARLDLVVRERKSGLPLFRQMLQEIAPVNNKPDYSDDYGHLGPSVYNPAYKDTTWAGYESYSRPIKTFNIGGDE